MQIIVLCPRCQSRYQLEASLKGQAVRCPSPTCGQVFQVPDEESPAPAGAGGKQSSGTVGAMVPLLNAEQAGPAPAARPSGDVQDFVPLVASEMVQPALPAGPSWQQQPPPVRKADAPQAKALPPVTARPPKTKKPVVPPSRPAVSANPGTGVDWRQQAPPPRPAGSAPPAPAEPERLIPREVAKPPAAKKPAEADGPIELAPGAWEAPPVRQAAGPVDRGATATPPPESELEKEIARARRARRRARLLLAGLAVVVCGLIGGAIWYVQSTAEEKENKLQAQAREKYQELDFVAAARLFRSLEKDYPQSSHLPAYRLHAGLSEVRQPAYSPLPNLEDAKRAYEKFVQFVDDNRDNELLQKARADVRNTLYKFTLQLTSLAERQTDPAALAVAQNALKEARKYRDQGANDPEDAEAEAKLTGVAQTLVLKAKRQELLARLEELARRPSGNAVKEAHALVRSANLEQPGVGEDADVQSRINQVILAHQARVKYVPVQGAPREHAPPEDSEPSLLVAARVDGLGLTPWSGQSPILALARGVLYALQPSSGKIAWAARVGSDTTTLPVCIPAFKSTPELVLVASADTRTLSGLDARDAKALWHHRLSAPCLGRPTVVRDRIYVPCYDGRVEEIETATGKPAGYFDIGQTLSLGGVYDEESHLLYLPADSFCVYILDLAQKRCAGILYTNHPSGSLHCEPILLQRRGVPPDAPPDPKAPRTSLVLCQADGLDWTELKVFSLPIARSDAAPLPLNLRVKGWSWFPPYQDAEKLGLVTDRGVVALFGICQKSNRDPLLYPLLDQEFVLARGPEVDSADSQGRAQMVYFDESNLWILAAGRLHRLQWTLGSRGQKLTELWNRPLVLGSPLHAAQVDPERKLFYLVTQSAAGQTCLASAVAAEAEGDDRDKVKWRTQLGMAAQGDPVAAGGAVLVQDQRGSLFRFEAAQVKDENDVVWLPHEKLAARPPDDPRAQPLQLLPAPGGALALVGVGREGNRKLIVRHVDLANNKIHDDPAFALPAPLAGRPGVWSDRVVLPLNDGVLQRKQFGAAAHVPGPNWRANLADENAPGYVVPLNESDFLVTDGSRGLTRIRWPKNDGNFQSAEKENLPARIVTAPMVQLLNPDGTEFRVFVADADNYVNLLQGDMQSGRFETSHRLALPGKITAGPFPLGKGVACIVEQRLIIFLDEEKNREVWRYQATDKADIVGQPALVGGLVIVADREGRFVGLDPATGKARGPGYELRAKVAPAASPVAFGADRVFAPLTDGTVLLLAVKRLEALPGAKVP